MQSYVLKSVNTSAVLQGDKLTMTDQ